MVLPRVQVRELRRTYGFEEVAIVPGDVTTNPELSVPAFKIGPYQFSIPIMASAMDAIVSPAFAGLIAKAGGLAVMNLEGVYGRYDDPQAAIEEVPHHAEPEIMHNQRSFDSSPKLTEAVMLARDVGIRHHSFHYYGMSRRHELEWIGDSRDAWAKG